MKKVDISSLKSFSIEEVIKHFGTMSFQNGKEKVDQIRKEEIEVSGTYKIVIGSRGMVEEIVLLGDLDLMEVEIAEPTDMVHKEDETEEDYNDAIEYFEEWMIDEVEDGRLNVGVTEEEGYDVMKIKLEV